MIKINIDEIIDLIEPVIADEGFELVDVEFTNEQIGQVLRLFIDKDDGVTVTDCAGISREISNLLEVEEIIPVRYNLEVSSPGLNRPLRKKEHFQKVIGEKIKVKTNQPVDGAKNFKAKLIEATDTWIKVDDGIKETTIDLVNIIKARLIYRF